MRTSIATVSLSGDLRAKLSAISKAGFDGVELFENDLLTFDGSPKIVRQLLQDNNLELVAFQPLRDFEGMPEPQRTKNFERAAHKFELMQKLGTDLLLICSNVSPQALGGLDRTSEDLHELGELAAKHGVRVGFEALAWGKHLNDYRDAWEVVRRANHKNIGTILDTFHILAKNLEVNSIASIPKEKIFLVQVADAPRLEMGVVPWSRHFRNFPGQGRLPLASFMNALGQTRYDGYLSLEIFNDQFRAAPVTATALDGYRSLVYMQELWPNSETKTEKTKPNQTHGIGFIEFSAKAEMAKELEVLFGNLGFEKMGQHRSKNVSLYRQGKAQLIINAENQGFAPTHRGQHQTSVCAIALEVEEVRQSLKRAEDFKYQVFRHAVQTGEHEIPGILGVDGSLIYLLDAARTNDDFWSNDFHFNNFHINTTATENSSAGLTTIDHIGQVVPFSQSLSWKLFYRSIFGLEASNLTEFPDPSGLIQSQIVENQDKSLRMVLNASQYSGTLAAKFLAGFADGGVQHIAFSTKDIFQTLEIWEKNGVEILKVSENYYGDLKARFGFEDALLNRMQALGIVYDRDDAGEFFHAYTHTIANLFFFEICERKNYEAYGATNAAIRVAAQTRLDAKNKNGGES